ncbi:4548_t:CDS:2, partial [Racocetra fulgida]
MPARRRPAESQGSPSTNTQDSTYASPRSTRSKSNSRKNGINNNDNGGVPYISSPKYTAYLRERNLDFSREEAFLRAMQQSDFWPGALTPPAEPSYPSYYPDEEGDTNLPESIIPGIDSNVINTREIINTNGNGPNVSTRWNPLKPLINFLVGSLAFLLNAIGSAFFYLYWFFRETPNFIWKNLTEDENGPFIETIVGIDRNVPSTTPNYIVIAITNVLLVNRLITFAPPEYRAKSGLFNLSCENTKSSSETTFRASL